MVSGYCVIDGSFGNPRVFFSLSFLDTEMKLQIRAPNKLTNKVTALRINVAAR